MSRQINLLNPSLLPARPILPARQILLGWGAIAIAAVALLFWETVRGVRLDSDAQAAAAQVQSLQAKLGVVGAKVSARKPTPELAALVAKRQELLTVRQNTLELLSGGTVGDATGHARFLRAFARQSLDGLWLTGLIIDGSGGEITVQGRALDPGLVPDYLRRLGNEPMLAGLRFDHLQMQWPQPVAATPAAAAAPGPRFVEFSVETRPKADAAGGGRS